MVCDSAQNETLVAGFFQHRLRNTSVARRLAASHSLRAVSQRAATIMRLMLRSSLENVALGACPAGPSVEHANAARERSRVQQSGWDCTQLGRIRPPLLDAWRESVQLLL